MKHPLLPWQLLDTGTPCASSRSQPGLQIPQHQTPCLRVSLRLWIRVPRPPSDRCGSPTSPNAHQLNARAPSPSGSPHRTNPSEWERGLPVIPSSSKLQDPPPSRHSRRRTPGHASPSPENTAPRANPQAGPAQPPSPPHSKP